MKSIRELDSKEKYIYMYTDMHSNMIDIPHTQTQTKETWTDTNQKRIMRCIDDKWWYGCDEFMKELLESWNDMTIFITYQIHLSEIWSSNQQLFFFVNAKLEIFQWNFVLKRHRFLRTNTTYFYLFLGS